MNSKDQPKQTGNNTFKRGDFRTLIRAGYHGVCGSCNKEVEIEDMAAIVVGRKSESSIVVLSLEYLYCPHCSGLIGLMEIHGDHLAETKTELNPPKNKGMN